MSGSPRGWTQTTVGSAAETIQYGYTAKASTDKVGPRLLRITDIQDNPVDWSTVPYCEIESYKVSKHLLSTGDLVFARTGATVGKRYLIAGDIPDAIFASYLIRGTFPSDIDPRYVRYFFQSPSYWLQIKQGQVGIGQPNVNSKTLAAISLPLLR